MICGCPIGGLVQQGIKTLPGGEVALNVLHIPVMKEGLI